MHSDLLDENGKVESRGKLVEEVLRMLSATFGVPLGGSKAEVGERENRNRNLRMHSNKISVYCEGLHSKNRDPSDIKDIERVIKIALAGHISALGYRKPTDLIRFSYQHDLLLIECYTALSVLFNDGTYVPLIAKPHIVLKQEYQGIKSGTVGGVKLARECLHFLSPDTKHTPFLCDVGQALPTDVFGIVSEAASMLEDDGKRPEYGPDDWRLVVSEIASRKMQDEEEESCKRVERKVSRREEHAQRILRQQHLDKYGNRCSVIGFTNTEALDCAHIKMWCDCKNSEGFDFDNAFLLTPTLHRLFDAGLISFADSGEMLFSKDFIANKHIESLGKSLCPDLLTSKRLHYMAEHRKKFGFV
jgi:hypothetical protein